MIEIVHGIVDDDADHAGTEDDGQDMNAAVHRMGQRERGGHPGQDRQLREQQRPDRAEDQNDQQRDAE